jgi:mono/diheme cytochrome c family protein
MKRKVQFSIAAALSLVLLAACGKIASPPPEIAVESDDLSDTEPVALGELQYTLYCASCHGVTGKGDGPVADALKVRPTNLTLLESINEGTFPEERLTEYIDGREYVAAHGSRVMPVWGNVWHQNEVGRALSEEEVQRRIAELVEYIRSIQE